LDEMFVKNGVFEKSPNRKKSKKISRIENWSLTTPNLTTGGMPFFSGIF
jgi:hypothetical protein